MQDNQENPDIKTEEDLNRSYNSGKSDGLRQAGDILMEKAKILFMERSDTIAFKLRDIADELFNAAELFHPGEPK